VIKARRVGGETREFFSVQSYQAWQHSRTDGGVWKVKYYKGLGTSTADEGRRYFRDLDKHRVDMHWDNDADDDRLSLAFAKDRAADRKGWLLASKDAWTAYEASDPSTAGLLEEHDHTQDTGTRLGTKQVPAITSYSSFVDEELVHFSLADVRRSIPSAVDGMKPS